MWLAETIDELRARRGEMSGPVGLVPTMGALHAGHLSLIEAATDRTADVIVSIFVNPTQFGPDEDFERYPRPVEHDLEQCEAAGVAGIFQPSVDQMYPPHIPAADVAVATLCSQFEGAFRPGHLPGVCRVVLKLMNIVRPDFACFGRKDFQQLRMIQAMLADLNLPIGIIECPTVREPDGLAVSSRNIFLTGELRPRALGLHQSLQTAAMLINRGESDPSEVEAAMAQSLRAHHVDFDYAVVRHPLTLAAMDIIDPKLTGGVIALVAGRVDGIRLIDNMLLGMEGQ